METDIPGFAKLRECARILASLSIGTLF